MSDGLDVEHLKSILGEVVDALPKREREVLTALYWERVGVREVARRMKKNPGSVFAIHERALRRIRKLVGDG